MECKICNLPNPEPAHFYKTHKKKESTYYEEFFPKTDLLTGKTLTFKSRDTYFLTDFENRTNLKKYLLGQSKENARNYCLDYLKRLKEAKKLVFFPTQVELRSRLGPGMIYLLNLFGSYDELCSLTGLNSRIVNINNEVKADFISVDSREQKPLNVGMPRQTAKLSYGDYCLGDPEKTNLIIERKSLPDLIGSFGSDIERLERELYRARLEDKYIVVLVEARIEDALNFRYLPWISKKIKVSPDYVMHNIRNLLRNNNYLQFLFVNSRITAQHILPKLLKNPDLVFKYDLQYLYDSVKL